MAVLPTRETLRSYEALGHVVAVDVLRIRGLRIVRYGIV